MMKNLTARVGALGAGAMLAATLVSGCSTSAKTTAGPTGAAAIGIKTASIDSKVCAAMTPAQTQAILKPTATAAVVNPGECSFNGGILKIDFYVNDADKSFYNNLKSSASHPLTGIGDEAYWDDGIGEITPSVGAHKGNVTCDASGPSDAPDTTLTYTGNPPLIKITDADGLAYAQKLAALCTDVFSVTG